MKYLPAFNIIAPGIYEAVRSGRLLLQPGQWVKIGDDPLAKPSRFISASPGYMNIVHPTGPFARGRFTVEVFKARMEVHKRHRN